MELDHVVDFGNVLDGVNDTVQFTYALLWWCGAMCVGCLLYAFAVSLKYALWAGRLRSHCLTFSCSAAVQSLLGAVL